MGYGILNQKYLSEELLERIVEHEESFNSILFRQKFEQRTIGLKY